MFNTSPSLADIAAVSGNRNNDGFGGDWFAWVILLALFWGGNGFGFGNGNNGVGAEIQRGFDTQEVLSGISALKSGICDSTFALNNTVQQGNFGLQAAIMQGFNAAAAQAADCCCTTNRNIDQLRFDDSQNTCAIITAINAVGQTVKDEFCAEREARMQRTIDEQASLINSLNLAQSQANQNAYLVNALRPAPVPSYTVPNPYAGYGYGQCGCNTGCGCNY